MSAGDFAVRYREMTRHAFTVLGVQLGSRLGLFDIMAAMPGPTTASQIADAGGYRERYVREWLRAMVCAQIIDLDNSGSEHKFHVSADKLPVLTGSGSQAVWTWSLPCIASVNEELIQCFKKDGPPGVPYSSYPYFHEWREQRMRATYSETYIQEHISRIPGLQQKLACGVNVLGIGSSSGVLEIRFARMFPKSTFTGIDISEEAIKTANEHAQQENIDNVSYLAMDIYDMPSDWSDKYDVIIGVDILHDLPHPCDALKSLKQVMKPGGVISIIDIGMHTRLEDNLEEPSAGVYYTLSLFHCMTVSLRAGGTGVGTVWGMEQAVDTFKQAGFNNVEQPADDHFYCFKE